MKRAFTVTSAALCLAAAAMLSACAELEAPTAVHAAALEEEGPSAQLRVVHAAATAGAFDIYLGSAATTPAWTGVTFGSATGYADVPVGSVELVFRAAGAAADAPPVYTSGTIVLGDGERVTGVAGGLVGSTLPATRFRVQAYAEAFAADAADVTRVRFVQESHGITAAGFDLGADGTIEAAGLAAFSASDAAGVAVAPHGKPLQLAIATGTPAKKLTAFTLPPAATADPAGDGVFLILVGVPTFVPRDPRGLALLAVTATGTTLVRQNPTVYLLSAVPDAPTVDAYAFGQDIGIAVVGEDVAFGALAAPLQVPPSENGYLLVTTAVGAPFVSVASTGALAAGERYLAVVSGFAGASCANGRAPVGLTVLRDGFETKQTAKGRVRALAFAPDAPTVDVGQFPPGEGTPFVAIPGLGGLAYGAASAELGVEVSSAPLNPGVRTADAATTLRFRFGALGSAERAFAVLVGAFAPAPAAAEAGGAFVIVKTPVSGAWNASLLAPQ